MIDQFIKILLVILFVCSIIMGCQTNKQTIKQISYTDNPVYHYARGMKLILENDINNANAKINRALQLNNNHAPSIAAKSLIYAIKSLQSVKVTHINIRKSNKKRALQYLKQAIQKVDNTLTSFIVHVTAIRVYTILKNEKWLKKAVKSYQIAINKKINSSQLPYYKNIKAADFFIGIAYMEAHKFKEATINFSNVLMARDCAMWKLKADQLLKKTQCIVHASKGFTLSKIAGKIAVKNSVTRADVSMLLIHELKIEKLNTNFFSKHKDFNTIKNVPLDIINHPFKNEISTIISLKIRGLSPVFETVNKTFAFNPQKNITRKEFALILEDILIKLTDNQSLATSMLGMESSPFNDVKQNTPWFNAIMIVTNRNLMENDLNGDFRPDDPVDGASLLLAIFKLRQRSQ